jgi:hypothetical protein
VKSLAMVMVLASLGATAARGQQDTTRTSSSAAFSAGGEEGWLGMGISCSRCSLQSSRISARYRSGRPVAVSSGGAARWTFSEPPVVFSVEPDGPADRAGLMTGDTLVSIDGHPLTSAQGGERFAGIQPGQAVTLRYRRDGQESEARVTAGARARSAEFAMQDSLRTLARLQARQQAQLQREMELVRAAQQRAMERSQSALERQREYMERAMEQLQSAEGQFSDSTRQAAVQRTRMMLDSAVARWRVAESLYAQVPVAPVAPVGPVAPVMPTPPTAALAPVAPMMPYAPVAPLNYAEHRAFGALRYTGQLGDVVIEARSPWSATATEVSDSEVVVTSRDLSVRIAIRPRRPTPTPHAAPAPKSAPAPRPTRTPKPQQEEI